MPDVPESLARVMVVGTTGSGKTTAAKSLAALLGSVQVELDVLHWGPNWTPTPAMEFRSRVEEALAVPRWVCDGNYKAVQDVVVSRATAVIWLNYSFPRVFYQTLARTTRRIAVGERLWANNQESLTSAFFSRDSILLWVIRTHLRKRKRYTALFAGEEWSHLRRVELRTPRQTRQFLDELKHSSGPPSG